MRQTLTNKRSRVAFGIISGINTVGEWAVFLTEAVISVAVRMGCSRMRQGKTHQVR